MTADGIDPLPDTPTDWLEFPDPSGEFHWRVNLSFLMSNWSCLFGRGCPGMFGVQDAHTDPDAGCCDRGAYVTTRDDLERVQQAVEGLTEQDLDPERLEYIRKHGWRVTFADDGDRVNVKTKVRDGLCVFSNRSNESGGRMGCAFHHRAQRLGLERPDSGMPQVCWQLPLMITQSTDSATGDVVKHLDAWHERTWIADDEARKEFVHWWCVSTPDAYDADSMLYIRMEPELRRLMGDDAYALLTGYIAERGLNHVAPMPGQIRNDGVKQLPLFIANRTPKRTSS